jgi:hypothetical protein
VARSTCGSQKAKNTTGSDHFWRLRCLKHARPCGAKHIWKSKCKTRSKPRTRTYARSWTTNANLCDTKTKFFLHPSYPHIISANAPEQQFTKKQLYHQYNNITTSTTKSQPA